MRGTESTTEIWLRRGLSRLGVELRSDELRPCLDFFLLHFLLLTFQYVCKAVRQATFLDSLGAERLPWVYLLVAVCSYPMLRLYGGLTDRLPRKRLLRGALLIVALSLLLLRVLFNSESPLFGLAFYLWISLVSAFLVSLFWSHAAQQFDPRQARRLFGLVGAGGLLGSVVGGQIARLVSQFGDTPDALLVAALTLAAAALFGGRSSNEETVAANAHENLSRARDGAGLVRQSPYLRRIALLMLLSTLVAQGIDLQFSWAIEQATGGLDQRAAVFGNLYSLTGIVAFLFQGLLTTRIHRRLGVGFALRLLPTLSGLGSLGFLLAALLQPAWLLTAIWTLKIGDNALRYSLDQSTRELLFLPMSEAERPRAKAFVDVFVQRSAKGIAALGLLSVPLGWLTVVETVGFSLGATVLWLLLISDLRRRYVASFRRGLRDPRRDTVEPAQMRELATLEMLVERLGSSDSREVLNAVDLLERHGRGHLISPLMLHHDDADVRCRVLEILKNENRLDALPRVERLLSDPIPEVRVTAIRVLAAFNPHQLENILRDRLRDADPRLRGAAIGYLLVRGATADQAEAERRFREMSNDGDATIRCEAARVLGNLDAERFQPSLVRLLYDADVEVCREAMRSVRSRLDRGDRSPLYAPILVSHLRHRKLKHRARETLVAYGTSVLPALEHFLLDVQEGIWVRRALPKTIATIGGPEAVSALLNGLTARDLFLRRKVIEALVSLESQAQANGSTVIEDRPRIEQEIQAESGAYSKIWLDLQALGDPTTASGFNPRPPDEALLLRLLAERLLHRLHNLFGLLALIYPMRDMNAAHLGLLSPRPEVRHHALEYLDNILHGEVRRAVFTVIDDLPLEERLRQIKRLFGWSVEDAATTLERLIFQSPPQDADADGLAAAALCFVSHQTLGSHQTLNAARPLLMTELIERACQEPRDLVRETAKWLRETAPDNQT